ncbi:response regulator transcription factor [Mameliella sediminis]|uniref:response regulator transcription factor n=1 Tax=Mameliella sediminis TaxID=2836866 RepID=UPI001C48ACFF|nr:response regulator transcription factor [Mameliella sediminis]MBY6116335.1 response regulator transcription factor [Antarctobacter heliothermus]MBY6145639.1 response regulator transcription factor [Mameliella alba]MBV7393637.1 response regulator transcription factor [Mameliella sediminis]MBY6160963.1 response regulator transcription factor [Mameliella alba]MBY6169433.1 response regulator transcription factor [Mameliella alba]
MRILIADDHDLLRDTLVAFLGAEQGFEIGTAASYPEAQTRIREDAPYDLVLLDYKMPGMMGLDSLKEALEMEGGQRVALISGEATREIAEQALEMGAAGFVPKTLPAKSLVNAVRFMAMGEKYAPIDFMTAPEAEETNPLAKKLTPREMDVLKGLGEGKSNKEIARDLGLTEPTIKLHMKTLYRKLEVNNRTQAALAAREAGLF